MSTLEGLLRVLGDLGSLSVSIAADTAGALVEPHPIAIVCLDLRGLSPFGRLEDPMSPETRAEVDRIVSSAGGSVLLVEGHAAACLFDDPQGGVEIWSSFLRGARNSTGHHVSGGLAFGSEKKPQDRVAVAKQAAALADAAGPGELLSMHAASDDDLVTVRVGDDVPAIYSIRSRT